MEAQSFSLDTGEVRIAMDSDESRIIKFNPTDIDWARRFEAFEASFYRVIKSFQEKARPIDRITRKLTAELSAIDIDIEDLREQIEVLENPTKTEEDENTEPAELPAADVEEQIKALYVRIEALEESRVEPEKQMRDAIAQGNTARQNGCIELLKELDALFGAGTSKTVFGDLLSEYAIGSFIEQITPYITETRRSKIDKYTKKNTRVIR